MMQWSRPLFAAGFALALVACVADPSGETGSEQLESPVQKKPTSDPSCHVPSEGISGGTRDGIWCCGVKTCNDKEVCGEYYGKQVQACAACDYYECIPGSGNARPPRWGGTRHPPGGADSVFVDAP
jgi:hypothetical protein